MFRNGHSYGSFSLRHFCKYLFAAVCLVFSLGVSPVFAKKQTPSDLISIKEVGRCCGLQYNWKAPQEKIHLNNMNMDINFQVHKRECTINNIKVSLSRPPEFRKGDLYIARKDYDNTILPIFFPNYCNTKRKIQTIVLDAGHGGVDNGAENKKYNAKEKELALELTMRIQELLRKKGFRVLLTRSKDVFIPLALRPQFANTEKADLFISIHFNSAEAKSARGLETYAMSLAGFPSTNQDVAQVSDYTEYPSNKHDFDNTLLAYSVQSALIRQVGMPDRSLRRARFAVLRDLRCPGILIEGGFLSNDEEAKKIISPAYRQQLAEAVVDGVVAYQKKIEKRS